MKTKRTFARFLVLASITLLLVFSGCGNPFSPQDSEPAALRPSLGTGFFSLNLKEVTLGRTILPDALKLGDFAVFKLEFLSGNTVVKTEDVLTANLSNPILLDVGAYELHVTAYLDTGKAKPAAWGSVKNIVINSGETTNGSVELGAIGISKAPNGQGTFKWTINYPATGITGNVKITPIDETGTIGTEQIKTLGNGTPDSLNLNVGYYRVVFSLRDNVADEGAERREILHVYQNMESAFACTFNSSQFISYSIKVTDNGNNGPGTLRQAINDVLSGGTITVDSSVETITLTNAISTSRSFTLEGNGVIIKAPSLASTSTVFISSSSEGVTIRRIHFTGIQCYIIDNYGNLCIESCVFSNNNTSNSTIYFTGVTSITASTFYNNSSYIMVRGTGNAPLTVTGNLFYGNTFNYALIYNYNGSITSNSYNVVDVSLGTGSGLSGWVGHSTDKVINEPPIAPASFKLLSGSGAQNVIATRPAGYPTVDFYGNTIPATNAAAGAVQSVASGYFVDVTLNNSALGSAAITVAPALNADGLYEVGSVTVEATAEAVNAIFQCWVVNGQKNTVTSTTLTLQLTGHYKVKAVFGYPVNDLGGGFFLLHENVDPNSTVVGLKITSTQLTKLKTNSNYSSELLTITKDGIYSKFKDDFDFIFFVLDKVRGDIEIVDPVTFDGVNIGVSNDVIGIGMNTSSNASYWGSAGKLKSAMYLPFYTAIRNGPTLHELAHNWGNSIVYTYDRNDKPYGKSGGSHWGVSNAGGQLGGFKNIRTVEVNSGGVLGKTKYQASFDGSYKDGFGLNANGGNGLPYSDIELYLMGMKSVQELRNANFRLDVYSGNSIVTDADGPGYFYSTTKTSYSIDNIIEINGARVPSSDSTDLQKHFKILTVVLIDESSAENHIPVIINDLEWFAGPEDDNTYLGFYNFSKATYGVGSLEVSGIRDSLKD